MSQQLIPYLPAILTIAAIVLGSVFNNRRIDDLKDLFKAEIGGLQSEIRRLEGVMNARFEQVDDRFDRVEQRLDAIEHRVGRLEDQRIVR